MFIAVDVRGKMRGVGRNAGDRTSRRVREEEESGICGNESVLMMLMNVADGVSNSGQNYEYVREVYDRYLLRYFY